MATWPDPFFSRMARFIRPSRLPLPLTGMESLRIERVIAVARLFLCAITLVAVDFDPIVPASYEPVARTLLAFFAAHSMSALFVLRRRERITGAFVVTTHVLDILAGALTLPMASPTNPFFAFFLFVLASAAFRWGLWETVATTGASLALVMLHGRVAATLPVWSLGGRYEAGGVIVRGAYLAMMGLLLGYLAEESRLLRAEAGAIAKLLGRIRVEAGVTRALRTVSTQVVDMCCASRMLIVLEDLHNQRLFQWDTSGGWSVMPVVSQQPHASDRSSFFFCPDGKTLAIVRRQWLWSPTPAFTVQVLDADGRPADTAVAIPESFVAAHPFRRLISVPVRFGDEWAGRIFVFDPALHVSVQTLVRFLQMLVRQVGPAIVNVHLQTRLRARVGALERARVARELHDGVIQSLIGVEMQLEVMRGSDAIRATSMPGELARLQQVVRGEVISLRELMQQMRTTEFEPDGLLEYLADMVQRFGRDTGITAHFACDLREARLPRHVCFELARIVQEGLVNVRKHSAATSVVVRFGVRDNAWMLEIDDDGRGFPFEGRLGHADLEARRSGPVIITERVRSIGGRLAIDSTRGRGSRLQVLVPQEARG